MKQFFYASCIKPQNTIYTITSVTMNESAGDPTIGGIVEKYKTDRTD